MGHCSWQLLEHTCFFNKKIFISSSIKKFCHDYHKKYNLICFRHNQKYRLVSLALAQQSGTENVAVFAMSWSRNCPNMVNIWFNLSEGTSLAVWKVELTSLTFGKVTLVLQVPLAIVFTGRQLSLLLICVTVRTLDP